MNKKLWIIVILIVIIISVKVFFFSPFPKTADKIIIQNGSTGETVELNQSQKDDFLKKLESVTVHFDSIKLPRMGYKYHILFDNKRITIRSDNLMNKSIIWYKVDQSITEIIDALNNE